MRSRICNECGGNSIYDGERWVCNECGDVIWDDDVCDSEEKESNTTNVWWDWRDPAVYHRIRSIYGDDTQVKQAIQELSECITSLTRYQLVDIKKHDYFEVIEECVNELADALNMIDQMADIFGREAVEEARQTKIERTRERMIQDGKDVSLGVTFPCEKPEKLHICPSCGSPEFHVISVQGAIVTCQCDHCFNAFPAPGTWTFVDEKDGVKVKGKKKEGKM